MTIYFPDAAERVPPVAERCQDVSEPSGRCRFSGRCKASRQKMQRFVLRTTGAKCPWYGGLKAQACYDSPQAERV